MSQQLTDKPFKNSTDFVLPLFTVKWDRGLLQAVRVPSRPLCPLEAFQKYFVKQPVH